MASAHYDVRLLFFIIALTGWQLASLTSAQHGSAGVLTLNGEGPLETQFFMLRAFRQFEASAAVPMRLSYRATSSDSAAASIAADAGLQGLAPNSASSLQFAVAERPLLATERTNFSASVGDSVHVPLYANTYGLFYNVPGNRARSLNISACLAARILKGDISDWTHPDLIDVNPKFVKASVNSYRITVLIEPSSSSATMALLSWLAKACPSIPVTYSAIRTDAVVVGTKMISQLQAVPFAFGYAMGPVGRAASIPEFAVETSIPGQYITTAASNRTSMQAALAANFPSSLNGDYSAVTVANLKGDSIAPILTVAYLITRSVWNQTTEEAQKAEAMRALCAFLLSPVLVSDDGGMLNEYVLMSLGDRSIETIRNALTTDIVSSPSAVPYTQEDGNGLNVISTTRRPLDMALYSEAMIQLAELRKTIDVGTAHVLRGAGSSAVSLFIWRCFSDLRARSTSPLHLVYRAAGSGSGQSEIVAKTNNFQALLDFGASDTPMPDAMYTDLTANAKVSMVHIPILLAPMNFFVNIPEDALPTRQFRLSPCTAAKIMQADITSWSHSDITSDNNGSALTDHNITVFYRQLSSGTTAAITAYLTATCPSWRLGSGSLLTTWPPNFRPTANTAAMSASVSATPWSIGYMDVANGYEAQLLEVALRNRDGNFVTAQTADIPGAASALFKSDAWPKSPAMSFSSVTVINQPGASTFPIVTMPFMFVRTDLTSRGDSGALLMAFLTFMLNNYTQSTIAPAVGYSPLPTEVLQYTVERALPLLQIDTRAETWTFEDGTVLPNGQSNRDYVISSFANSYEHINALASSVNSYTLQQYLQKIINASVANRSETIALANTSVPAGVQEQLDSLKTKVVILQSIAIAGVTLGIIGLAFGMFSTCRIFVHSSLGRGQSGNVLVHPSSLNLGQSNNNSVRRQKSGGNISEGSFT